MQYLPLLTVLLLVLKLSGLVAISYWLVFLPIIAYISVVVLLFGALLFVALISSD